MAFTTENTTGYSQAEIDVLNAELARRLEGVADPDEQNEIKKNFADEVSRRP